MPRDADAATGTKEVGETDVVCGFYRSTCCVQGGRVGRSGRGGLYTIEFTESRMEVTRVDQVVS